MEVEQNNLLKARDGERLDTGTSNAAISADPEMAAVGRTGRKTAVGKTQVSRNAHKGGTRAISLKWRHALRKVSTTT
jgi:hypothetical protein